MTSLPVAVLALLVSLPASAVETITGQQLADRIRVGAAQSSAPVLLMAADADTELELRRWVRKNPGQPVSIALVERASEGEIRRALEGSGAGCGLQVALHGGAWDVTAHGDCSPGTVAVADPVAPAEAADDCFPSCSPGYFCHEQQCIESCNPPCGSDERCNEARVCMPRTTPPPAVVPAGEGTVCVFRERKFSGSAVAWKLEIDDDLVGSVASRHYLCVDVAPGEHLVRVTHPVSAGVGVVNAPSGVGVGVMAVAEPPTRARKTTVANGGNVYLVGELVAGAFQASLEIRELTEAEAGELRRELEPERAQ